MIAQHGDDLEDDFVPDDLVALSGEDDDQDDAQPRGDDIKDLLSAEEDNDLDAARQEEAAKEKKRKRRAKEKERKLKKRKVAAPEDTSQPTSSAAQSPQALADYMSSLQAKALPSLSTMELDDIRIPETSIVDTTQWTGSRSLDKLPDFIIQVLPTLVTRLSQRSKSEGSPTLLFICGAALRVADAVRVLRDKKLRGEKGGDVAKLFAKHFKLEDHVSYLKRTKIGSAAGTPGRVGKLLCDTGKSLYALSLSQLTHIILDASFRDAKERSLLDNPETRDEVMRTILGAPKVMDKLKEGRIQLVLF
ncbi:hypothetical protein CONPUDRAFT_117946 [Coniophora puteana RWD-64-598 SS2]|uniref:Uncharacterized protein n=1 Tax=Coniophora puteana (strain RWD-64-598) TaxID=741705 RepID=A0A5M3N1G7_CONPW|nr:uncharacterized protein CONPUDRAFT_117946 [Coniophora puteana RWD-64-598 SS2]EIW85250.1 hypothetical protein CONPUDRAFT_117946 [Coniophora puteana RWD-64-598 SS2]